jgi:uncharacterized membrane protein YjjP (DUF1212 family)
LDTSRLEQVEALARDAASGHLSPIDADARLVAIVAQKPIYPVWVQQLAYGVVGFSCALLFFGASFEDAGLSTLGGLLVGGICWVGAR